ncbi:TPA: hypothetical protein JAN90_07890 [Legionella pneumophila]|nr:MULTISPECIES: hypothetical protein [Legionella]MCW8396916.1 hypothetical protein [Legionella sp. PATHC039]HAT7072687.1 hypothetical protein [Legionella pneumophila]HCJ1101490.1 hypothetical protein [Legionella pneumophila]HCJ1111866.1 hypothetical protein [Legionella pneumophila]HCJ1115057.1 hypothetical protein [Legionella pneumophila]
MPTRTNKVLQKALVLGRSSVKSKERTGLARHFSSVISKPPAQLSTWFRR